MSEQEPNPFSTPASGAGGPVPYGTPGAYVSQGAPPGVGSYAAPPPPANVSAIILLVVSTLAVLPTFFFAAPAFVISIVALVRNRDAPASSRRLALIGWVLLALAVLVAGALWWWALARIASGDGPIDTI